MLRPRAARLALAAAIIAALFWYDVIDGRSLIRVLSDSEASIQVFGLLLVAFALCGIRWFLILRAFGLSLRLRRVIEILAIGEFFNVFLPGGTGGDVVRVVNVVRALPEARLRAAVSVFADRAIGLYGMLLVAMFLIVANSELVFTHVGTELMAWGVVALFAGITVGGGGLVLAVRPLQSLRLLRSWEERGGLYRFPGQAIAFLSVFRGSLPTMAVSIAISILASLLCVACVVAFALVHSGHWLGPVAYACAAVLSMLANAIPLTPGGIGVAEGAFAYLCNQWAGAATGAAFGTIFLSYRLMLMAVSLLGGIAIVTHQRSG